MPLTTLAAESAATLTQADARDLMMDYAQDYNAAATVLRGYTDGTTKVDEQAQHLLDTMIPRVAKAAGITEELKATDQMRWEGLMNAVKAQVEEIIFAELIYN